MTLLLFCSLIDRAADLGTALHCHLLRGIPRTPTDEPPPSSVPTRVPRLRMVPLQVSAFGLLMTGTTALMLAHFAPEAGRALEDGEAWVRTELASERGTACVASSAGELSRDSDESVRLVPMLEVELVRPLSTLLVEREPNRTIIHLGSSDVAWGATTLPRFDVRVREISVVRTSEEARIEITTWTPRSPTVVARGNTLELAFEW